MASTKAETFLKRLSYEEIEPVVSGTGRKAFLKTSAIIGACTLLGGSVVVLLCLQTFNSSSPVPPVPISDYSPANGVGQPMGLLAPAPNDAETGFPEEDVLLDLNVGSIRGKRLISRGGRQYLSFTGIPYGQPPVRFQPPVKAKPWEGVYNATEFKPDAIQKDKYNKEGKIITIGSEDCLYLNIFTPKKLATLKQRFDLEKFPVLVYIHGGKQYGNATRYGADYFMDENVLFVHFHYRIGVLGTLNLKTKDARGNQGLKDQVLALQWINDHISEFGGDKSKITIFGNSYGAIQVSAHLISPMSRGLFQRVICQSGVQLMPDQFNKDPMSLAIELGRKLNCTGDSPEELFNCFKNIDVDTLVLSSYLMEFGTSVEPPANTDDVFMPDSPLNLLMKGGIHPVSAIYGVNSGEGIMNSLPILNSPELVNALNEDWGKNAVSELLLNASSLLKDPERIANAAKKFYLGANTTIGRQSEPRLSAMIGDRRFFHPAKVYATFQLEKNKEEKKNDSVYMYVFNEQMDKSYGDSLLKEFKPDRYIGAGHADELQNFFPYSPFPYISLDSKYGKLSQMMIRLWTSFADSGVPTGALNETEWLPIEKDKPYGWFEIAHESKMIYSLEDRMKFWDSFNLTDLYV